MPPPPTARRAAGVTQERVVAAALEQVRRHGVASVSVNALARELGVSGPALYKHVAGLPELLDLVVARLYEEVTAAAEEAGAGEPDERRAFTMARALRTWALAHPLEFAAVFSSPVEPGAYFAETRAAAAGRRFGMAFQRAFELVLTDRDVPVPREAVRGDLERDLARYQEFTRSAMTLPQLHYFLECWVRIYGLVSMEALGQLGYAVTDAGPLFASCLRRIAAELGLPPEAAGV